MRFQMSQLSRWDNAGGDRAALGVVFDRVPRLDGDTQVTESAIHKVAPGVGGDDPLGWQRLTSAYSSETIQKDEELLGTEHDRMVCTIDDGVKLIKDVNVQDDVNTRGSGSDVGGDHIRGGSPLVNDRDIHYLDKCSLTQTLEADCVYLTTRP